MNNKGLSYILEESLGKQWHFYISDKQLLYTHKDKDVSSAPEVLDGQSPKYFCCTIDKNDTIYILVYTSTKQLHYYEWDGTSWLNKRLYNVSSRFENISFINMTVTSQNVHLFYYIENSLRRTQEALVHYYFKNGEWQKNEFFYFYSDHNVKPWIVDNTPKDSLYFIYTKKIQGQTHCYLSYFDTKTSVWTKPELLFKKTASCSDFRSFIDSSNNIHLIWKESQASKVSVCYKKVSFDFSGDTLHSSEILIAQPNEAIEGPVLQGSKIFYCGWLQGVKGMFSRSESPEKAWSSPEVIPQDDLKLYFSVRNGLDGRSRTNLFLGDGSSDYSWPSEKLLEKGVKTNNQKAGKEVDQEVGHEKIETFKRDDFASTGNSILSYKGDKSDSDELVKKQEDLSEKLDEIYTAIYQIQDHIQKRDRSYYQMDTMLRKLIFEVDQLRASRSRDYRAKSVNYEASMDEPNNMINYEEPVRDSGKPAVTGLSPDEGTKNEITLGNTTIIINPDETND